jgi:hypothetical protein
MSVWTRFVWLRKALVNTEINFRVQQMLGEIRY